MTIQNHLKEATREIHSDVEGENLARYIIDHSISSSDYIRLLQKNYLAYAAIEKTLGKHREKLPATLLTFVNTAKSEAIALDLKQFSNITLPSIDEDEMEFLRLPELIGMLYVSQGSMLGSSMIAKHVSKCKQLPEDYNPIFFGRFGTEAVLEWKHFKEALNQLSLTADELQIATQAAKRTFLLFD